MSVPGLPGCWSQGATEQEALQNIRDASRNTSQRSRTHSKAQHQNDILRCKYRMTPEELQRLLTDPDASLPEYRTDWKQCMELLGWEPERRSASRPPWGLSH